MTQFKVGDRVRYIHDGEEGTIQGEMEGTLVDVLWDDEGLVEVDAGDLELVEEPPLITRNREPIEGALYRAIKAIDPDHYKFPGGAEVIDISQWLTANAAQALQYVARSSRIDGKNKGDASEDIRKAITFLEFELKRLEESE